MKKIDRALDPDQPGPSSSIRLEAVCSQTFCADFFFVIVIFSLWSDELLTNVRRRNNFKGEVKRIKVTDGVGNPLKIVKSKML